MKHVKNGTPRIEKGIPIPTSGAGGSGKGYAELVRRLEVGDSVLFQKSHQAHNAIRYVGGSKQTHTCRKTPDGYRVWRIA
jgi:hypothetical protein